MNKLIVETPDSTQLMGSLFSGEDRVPFDRPAVVVQTSYIELKLASRAVVKLADVPDSATDATWAEHLAEAGQEDMAFAIDSYISTLPSEAPPPAPVTDEDKNKRSKAGDDRAKGGAPKSGLPNSKQPALDPGLK